MTLIFSNFANSTAGIHNISFIAHYINNPDQPSIARCAGVQHFQVKTCQNQQENGAEGAEGAPDFAGIEGFVDDDDAEGEQDARGTRTRRTTH